jgi:Ca-activated chloride channel family protein
MMSNDKLPLLKEVFASFVEHLDEKDTISIVTYSGKEKVVLSGCSGDKKDKIIEAVNGLQASGSTNGQSGLQKAYSLAKDYFIEGGNNRIIMASDGDLNVGISSPEALKQFVSQKRDEGIYLSVLGFGTGNYKDDNMEALADNGNGNYFYIDSVEEGEKVLGTDLNATINTIANDVKFQIDFNHEYVTSYRLIGYENRVLNNEDFADDKKDAGEVGSGHCLTVAFEIVPDRTESEKNSDEFLTVCVRYKDPGSTESKLLEYPIKQDAYTETPNDDFYFASAVIEFAMVLRESKYCNGTNLNTVLTRLGDIQLNDKYKIEFKGLVEKLIEQSGITSDSSGGSRYQ